MKTFRFILSALFAVTVLPLQANQDENFPANVEVSDTRLELKNTDVLRLGLFFKIYKAALYTEPDTPPNKALEDKPLRLELLYYRDIYEDKYREIALKQLRKY